MGVTKEQMLDAITVTYPAGDVRRAHLVQWVARHAGSAEFDAVLAEVEATDDIVTYLLEIKKYEDHARQLQQDQRRQKGQVRKIPQLLLVREWKQQQILEEVRLHHQLQQLEKQQQRKRQQQPQQQLQNVPAPSHIRQQQQQQQQQLRQPIPAIAPSQQQQQQQQLRQPPTNANAPNQQKQQQPVTALGSQQQEPGRKRKRYDERDISYDLLRSIDVPDNPPSMKELKALFKQPLMRRGPNGELIPFKLPVHPALLARLERSFFGSAFSELLEDEDESGAWLLATAVSSALDTSIRIHDNLDDKSQVAGHYDHLFGRFVRLQYNALPDSSGSLRQQRYHTNAGLAAAEARPDWVVFVHDCLLSKGEDQPSSGSLEVAQSELQTKVQEWRHERHGKLEYLICYASAGYSFQLFALLRSNNWLIQLVPVADTREPIGRLAVLKAGLLLGAIIHAQAKSLPDNTTPLLQRIRCGLDGWIELHGDFLIKEVSWERLAKVGMTENLLRAAYKAAKGSRFVIQYRQTSPRVVQKGNPEARFVLYPVRAAGYAANIGHGDLQWANVIQISDHHYMLIDLESCLWLGTHPNKRRQKSTKAWQGLQVLDDNVYTADSDLMLVGVMLERMLKNQPELACEAAENLAEALKYKELSLDGALAHEWLVSERAGVLANQVEKTAKPLGELSL